MTQPPLLEIALTRKRIHQMTVAAHRHRIDGQVAAGQILFEAHLSPGIKHKTTIAAPLFTLGTRSEEHTSELQSRGHLVCRLLLEKKKDNDNTTRRPRLRHHIERIRRREP